MGVVHENIRFLRRLRGYTQAEFSNLLEITHAKLGSYEENRATPSDALIAEMAKKLMVAPEDLKRVNFKAEFQSIGKETKIIDNAQPKFELFDQPQTPTFVSKSLLKIVKSKDLFGYQRHIRNPQWIDQLDDFQLSLELGTGVCRIFEAPAGNQLDNNLLICKLSTDGQLPTKTSCLIFTSFNGLIYAEIFQSDSQNIKIVLNNQVETIQMSEIIELWEITGFISLSPPTKKLNTAEIKNHLSQIAKLLD